MVHISKDVIRDFKREENLKKYLKPLLENQVTDYKFVSLNTTSKVDPSKSFKSPFMQLEEIRKNN